MLKRSLLSLLYVCSCSFVITGCDPAGDEEILIDRDGDLIPDAEDPDDDNDGVPDTDDPDDDDDGIEDFEDEDDMGDVDDDDNDGIPDDEEESEAP